MEPEMEAGMKTETVITIETILEAARTTLEAKREKVMDILPARAPPERGRCEKRTHK